MKAVRVFIGTSPAGEDAEACAVCEYTLRRQASCDVEVTWLRLSSEPGAIGYGWAAERWSSPWSGLRWAVPALCDWSGRAVYFDCPQIIIGDVAALVEADMPPRATVLMSRLGRTLHLGCMVWDCERARGVVSDLPGLRSDLGSYVATATLFAEQPRLAGALPAGWGVVDIDYARAPGDATGSVHCANLYMQPHARLALPRLRRAGRDHWFRAVRMRHFCPTLVDLFDREYEKSQANPAFALSRYVGGEPVAWGQDAERQPK